ncbi:MAG: FtsX-like permease family protein [Vicinamibacterales bacterium]
MTWCSAACATPIPIGSFESPATHCEATTRRSRVPEIGVRLLLGASPWQIFRAVVGQGLRLATIGIAIGLVAAVGLTWTVSSLLFATSTTDPLVDATLSALLLAIAGTACYVPARRARRVDPMTALRSE